MSTCCVHLRVFTEFVQGKRDTLTIYEDSNGYPPIIGKMDAEIFYVSAGADEPDFTGDYIEFDCEYFERKNDSPFTNGAFEIKIKDGSLRLCADPREYFSGMKSEPFDPFLEPCPDCRGQGTWETECCSGAGGCSCQGQVIPMGTCHACNGSGFMDENYRKGANIDSIRGQCYTGSGPR